MFTLRDSGLLEDIMLLPIFGCDPGEDGDEGDEGEGGDSGNEGGDEGGRKPSPRDLANKGSRKSKKDDDDDDDEEDDLSHIADPKDRRIAELSREARNRRRELRAAQRELDEARATVAQKETDGVKGQETLKTKLAEANETISKLKGQMETGLLRNQINEFDTIKWHDTTLVIKELNRAKIDVDLEDGYVDGLQKELKRIAKEKPFLVKESSSGASGSGSTGSHPQGGSTNTQTTHAEQAKARFPWLANR